MNNAWTGILYLQYICIFIKNSKSANIEFLLLQLIGLVVVIICLGRFDLNSFVNSSYECSTNLSISQLEFFFSILILWLHLIDLL